VPSAVTPVKSPSRAIVNRQQTPEAVNQRKVVTDFLSNMVTALQVDLKKDATKFIGA